MTGGGPGPGGTGVSPAGEPPRRRGYSWTTAVVLCPISTALGLADDPGYLPGYGYVPAGIARDLLATADTWRAFPCASEIANQRPAVNVRILAGSIIGPTRRLDHDEAEPSGGLAGY